jgi:hypothetical protein
MILKNQSVFLPVIFTVILISACAKMGSLAGGKKDINPPRLVSSTPANYSTNFRSQKIEIEFDEFILLKSVNQELVISPPLPKKPDVRLKNKSIIIDLKNELRENTTYTLNFGKAIADNNEGNPLTNFEFVFSTGGYLDSLSVQGTIYNAFNLLPSKEPITIGLYDQTEDSVPLKNIPVYIGKTNDKGLFMINNIKSDTFKLFALKDLNYNLLYDLPTEEIGFIDTLITMTPEFLKSMPLRIIEKDTIKKDTLKTKLIIAPKTTNKKDKKYAVEKKLNADSLVLKALRDSLSKKPTLPALYVDMFYFLPERSKQYLTNKDRLSPENFQLSFSLPLQFKPYINIFEFDNSKSWSLIETSAKRDTFTYWLTDTTLIKRDTLKFELAYPMTDSTGQLFTKLDTVKFISRKPVTKTGKGKDKAPKVKLNVMTIRNNGVLDVNSDIPVRFNFPINTIDTSFFRLYLKVDTVDVLQKFEIVRDSVNPRRAVLISNWKEKNNYRIEAFPCAFRDIYQHTNDTMLTRFSVQDKSFYGALNVVLTEVNTPVLVQLMNEKETVLRAKHTESNGTLVFELLPPAKYKLKFVYDLNGNQKWDTGDYLKRIQPEKVLYYQGEINIRSNWDLEVKQSLKQ